MGIIYIVICLTIIDVILAFLSRRNLSKTRRHLRQIEKKIDSVYRQMRTEKYVNPSTYPFKTYKF